MIRVVRIFGGLCASTLVAAGLAIVSPGPAAADAAPAAHLVGRGVGYYYSRVAPIRSVVAGQSVNLGFEVVNDSGIARQYRVELDSCRTIGPFGPTSCPTGFSGQLYVGTTAYATANYITPLIAPGKTNAFTVKITTPAAAPQIRVYFDVNLYDPISGQFISSAGSTAGAEIAAPARGQNPNDMFLSAGGQPAIGAGTDDEYMESAAIQPGSGVSFTVKLQNDNTSSAADVALRLDDPGVGGSACRYAFSVRVTTGFTDVTTAVRQGSYSVHLNAGASRTFTVGVRYLANTLCIGGIVYRLTTTSGGYLNYDWAITPAAA